MALHADKYPSIYISHAAPEITSATKPRDPGRLVRIASVIILFTLNTARFLYLTMQLISHLKGHKASILCLETAQNAPLGGAVLASGSEDRTCRIWDLRTEKAAKAIRGLENEVTSICFPTKPSSPHLYLAVGKKVRAAMMFRFCVLWNFIWILDRMTPSLCLEYQVHVYDLRSPDLILSQSTRSYEFSQDELNQVCPEHSVMWDGRLITINDKDKYLATADDNGQVKVVDLETHQLYKQFRTKHDNICMAVRFRPKKPWDLFSGGMDNNLIQWDFSRGVPTVVWDMGKPSPAPLSFVPPQSITSAAPSDLTPGAQVFNPPFVYTIAASDDGHVMGVGLGDGSIK
ncbi:WD40-repeat-containing domain protein, partial [Jimgerdemannia flammicorona]